MQSLTQYIKAKEETMREQLAELEHEQWIAWSKNIAETETITPARLERWKTLWRPYSELTETEKDQDREWGDKDLALFFTTIAGVMELLREDILKEYHISHMAFAKKHEPDGEFCANINGEMNAYMKVLSLLPKD